MFDNKLDPNEYRHAILYDRDKKQYVNAKYMGPETSVL
jgi:hypothetical protein